MTCTLTIVTPAFNAAETIDRTILSVVTQAGDFRVRYHVQDGGSTDGTLARLAWWEAWLTRPEAPLPNRGVAFSWASAADAGMYDALVTGFDGLAVPPDGFMAWINADDVFMTGAFALAAAVGQQFAPEQVSWLGGHVAILRDDVPISVHDRHVPTAAVRAGLCDGTHWPFVQQEGTFFRGWLWKAARPAETIRGMRLAGDWNLWRLFAAQASLVQATFALGAFRLREGQMSGSQRDRYLAEIDALVPAEARRAALAQMAEAGPPLRRTIRGRYPGHVLSVSEEPCTAQLAERHRAVFGAPPPVPAREPQGERRLYDGKDIPAAPFVPVVAAAPPPEPAPAPAPAAVGAEPAPAPAPAPAAVGSKPAPAPAPKPEPEPAPAPAAVGSEPALRHLWQDGGIVAFDHGWQFPAITERHAFARLRATAPLPPGVTYVAYPWATLIDKLQANAPDQAEALAAFRAFCAALPQGGVRITVCQHILLKDFLPLFAEAGLAHVFWSHATPDDVAAPASGAPRLHPMPLYPVQVERRDARADADGRAHLFSFIGARPDRHSLTAVRRWILDGLAGAPGGLIRGREGWHYQRIVYDAQVFGRAGGRDPAALVDEEASRAFRDSLLASTFSLCPSGTGPNSIRLWESIGAGAIPVILSDRFAPPGPRALWEAACLFRPETEAAVLALPDELAAIAADAPRIAAMRRALRQLWLLYGTDGFVTDVQLLMHELAVHSAGAAPSVSGAPLIDRLIATATAPAGPDARGAALLLATAASALLLDPAEAGRFGDPQQPSGRAVAAARARLGAENALVRHFAGVLDHAHDLARAQRPATPATPTAPRAPALAAGLAPAVAFVGRHAYHTPLAYAPLRRLAGARLRVTTDPAAADVILTGFDLDLKEHAARIGPLLAARPGLKVAVMSEEPLWDTVWAESLTDRAGVVEAQGYRIPHAVLNHETSRVFAFERIPYFVLTTDTFPVRYANLFAATAGIGPQALLDHWRAAPIRAAFLAEKRSGAEFARRWPDRDIEGQSAWRSEVAAAMPGPGVLREGAGWEEGAVRRRSLPDWHLDKLAALDRRTRVAAAYENTHHPAYISEKLFDAFAVLAIPAYRASPRHRVFELVPEAAMLNAHGLDPAAAAARIAAFEPDRAFAEAWFAARAALRARLCDPAAILAERRRVVDAALDEIAALA